MSTVDKKRKFKAARDLCGLTQDGLAKAVGVSRQTIVTIEKGGGNPSLDLCKRICKTLNKTLNDLFEEE
ncbi:MAG: helix-turn-helix transcriptional regulator [Clostridia bacterium]|nr:helix-turn-helix transcriptional regulator [Clostridia bacterium]